MFPQVGFMEIIVVLVIALLVVGPKRLPALARDAGKAIRDFKNSVEGTMSGMSPLADDKPDPGRATAGVPAALDADDDDEILEGIVVSGADGPPPRANDGQSPTA